MTRIIRRCQGKWQKRRHLSSFHRDTLVRSSFSITPVPRGQRRNCWFPAHSRVHRSLLILILRRRMKRESLCEMKEIRKGTILFNGYKQRRHQDDSSAIFVSVDNTSRFSFFFLGTKDINRRNFSMIK